MASTMGVLYSNNGEEALEDEDAENARLSRVIANSKYSQISLVNFSLFHHFYHFKYHIHFPVLHPDMHILFHSVLYSASSNIF